MDSAAQTPVSLFHCRLFPFTHRSVGNAKIPNNTVEKTYRGTTVHAEGPGGAIRDLAKQQIDPVEAGG